LVLVFMQSPHLSNRLPIEQEPIFSPTNYDCILCNERASSLAVVLDHLYSAHRLRIECVDQIANLPKYLACWKLKKLTPETLSNYAILVKANQADGTLHDYYLLSEKTAEDSRIRESIRMENLEQLLAKQDRERKSENSLRKCLFCSETGNRTSLFGHMLERHKFNIGSPDNLVNLDELMDILEGKINRLQCLYFERLFKNLKVLKQHMRKKKHMRINSQNKFYDRFYIVNYLEPGKNWEELLKENDDDEEAERDDWDDWKEELSETSSCLFCSRISTSVEENLTHIGFAHNFDIIKFVDDFDDHAYIRLINYIRKKVACNTCIFCQETFKTKDDLDQHMFKLQHYEVKRDAAFWQDDQYLFPALKDDTLLTGYLACRSYAIPH